MIPIQKLKYNLKQSVNWCATFKNQIKQQLEEITQKNQEISQIKRKSITLISQIQQKRHEFKIINQQKQKIIYKTDRLEIQIQELENKTRIYDEITKKKQQWKAQLQNRAMTLQIDIEKEKNRFKEKLQNHNQINGQNQLSLSNISCKTVEFQRSAQLNSNIHNKEVAETKPQMDKYLKKLKNLESQYILQLQKCRHLQSKIQNVERIHQRFIENDVNQSKKYGLQNKQNSKQSSNQKKQKKTDTQYESLSKKLKQLQDQNDNLNKEIINEHKNIQNYATILNLICQNDTSTLSFHKQIQSLQRMIKSQKTKMHTISSYLLRQINHQ